MNQNLEHDQQASSEIRKKELNKKRHWKIFKLVITIAKIVFKVLLMESDNLDE